ncbi:MAG: bifunctional riboflavin kinase/FAD synthetase [Planctomycetota bacterium]|nr:bifunctional riboflavin kinase/FAD synthetase [Planctomycetota bacterium]
MKIIDNISGIGKIQKRCVLTIGNFDGVHIGHQKILKTAGQIARQKKTAFAVVTFEPHPLAVLNPAKAPGILTPLKLKEYLLSQMGVDYLILLPSTIELLALSPNDFVDRFVVQNIKPSVLVEGDDFNFGQGRGGNINTLKDLGKEKGFDVIVVASAVAKVGDGTTVEVSSTMIRMMLAQGRVADAAIELGRPYRLIGKIISGRGVGKCLGFPTLNMERPNQVVPGAGVYAGFVGTADTEDVLFRANQRIPAAYSVGKAETFGDDYPMLIEAHLLIENVGDLAGKWLAMDFIERIRDQKRFVSKETLIEQIGIDCKQAMQVLPRDCKV